MNELLEILKYTIPSIIVFAIVYIMVKRYFENEKQQRREKIILKNLDIITPLRLQAYERFTLFLERISPESLILRINKPGYTCKQLHNELLSVIRAEFEHNLAQQIYISNKAWELIKIARSNTVHLININAGKVQPDSPSLNLSKAILESTMDIKKIPTAEALFFLKEEVNKVI